MSGNVNEVNPFSGLFTSEQNISSNNVRKDGETPHTNVLMTKINALIEKIFLFTIRKNVSKSEQFVYMEDVAPMAENDLLNLELLEQALFERLLLISPNDYLIPSDHKDDANPAVIETRVVNYLFRSYDVCETSKNQNDSVMMDACAKIQGLIMRNLCTAMKQPDLFEGQTIPNQWLDILKDIEYSMENKQKFLVDTAHELCKDEELSAMGHLKTVFYPMFAEMQKQTRNASMVSLEPWVIPIMELFVTNKSAPQLGEILLDFSTPNPDADGIKYAETLFGHILSLSILPKNQNGPYEFYESPLEYLPLTITSGLWTYMTNHLDSIHKIFKSLLLLGGNVRSKTLAWIGNCIHANIPRGQIWNTHNLQVLGGLTTASDAFMIGICAVLLRLCKPLTRPDFKVLLVDPTYCAVPEADTSSKSIHMKKAYEETCLLSAEDSEQRLNAEKYNFITECFYMTHKAIDLSYRVCIEKFVRMSREIHRLQTAYQDVIAHGGTDMAGNIEQMLRVQMQQYLCLKNAIIEPNNDQLLVQFYEATAAWLTEVTSKTVEEVEEMKKMKSFAPAKFKEIKLPLTNAAPAYLRCIPEYVLENVIGYLTFIRHFGAEAIELDSDAQGSIFRMILVFMGSSDRVKNPHLRARLAEGLESFLPREIQNSMRSSFKTKIFESHPDRLEMVPNLLNVFVGIEMTGQSVQFEQKFNYRRPMYAIMDFLWEKEEQRECFKKLAAEAKRDIEAVNPPLFLRFVNLLINDAIFLLDESLSNLQQIRTLQAAQTAGEWSDLPQNEQQQNAANLQHLGMMARFDNILGRDTINILKLITTEIKDIFCHASMVDRIASMLNYFLLNLVGPKKSSFNVRDKKEFEFDPANTVREICSIYINLQDNDDFCLAVAQDGRSYSEQLFSYAQHILLRIGGGLLISGIIEFAEKVKRLEKQRKEDQEALVDPPDEYLDPIMLTLMLDPVILPSSHVTVDRTTIARHLLSDQSDPFNRSSLTMDQIKSNVQLKEEILTWIEQRRKEYAEKAENEVTTTEP